VALFADNIPDPSPRRSVGRRIGWSLLGIGLVGVVVVAVTPSPYVIERPGPVFDVLGDVVIAGDDVPLIQIPMEETFPTTGALRMLTVNIAGNREQPPNWLEITTAYFDPSEAVLPVDAIYPIGRTVEQSNEAGRIDMENSQQEAIVAALSELGYDIPSTLTVVETREDGAAFEVLMPGDLVLELNGETFPDVSGLRAAIAENGVDTPAEALISRDGVKQEIALTPRLSAGNDPAPVLGIVVASEYDLPFTVKIQLENVGGPSAGMMFALGIIDKLSEDSLTGGEDIAGTGTITGTGEVGPIGGIRQKMWGAVRSGADWFLAPDANCSEVTGNIPSGLTVFAVATLDDALAALDAISTGADTAALPTCPAA
jgi:PDZ domain-containing protein